MIQILFLTKENEIDSQVLISVRNM